MARVSSETRRSSRGVSLTLSQNGAAVHGQELREEPALAVPDHDHAAEGRVGAGRVQLGHGLAERSRRSPPE